MANNTTVPKIKIIDAHIKDTEKLDLYACLFEWLTNTTYTKSKNTFILIMKNRDEENEEDEVDQIKNYKVFFACDKSDDSIDLNNLISFKSSHNITKEVGHHGDGFKRFSYKHLGLMEVYSFSKNNKEFTYLSQDHKKIKDYINTNPSNLEFEKVIDSSEYTTFSTKKKINQLPMDIYNLINNSDINLPFFPKFLVSFSNLDKVIESYNDVDKYEALKDIIRMINYNHLDNIYMMNELVQNEDFINLQKIDTRGEKLENIKYEIKTELFCKKNPNNKDEYFVKIINPKEFCFKVGPKRLMMETECDDLQCELVNQNKIADITIREIKDELNDDIKEYVTKYKYHSEIHPPKQLEKFPGIFIILNGVPVNYLPSANTWLAKSGNLPGRSRYRCIIEPYGDINFDKLISTDGIKTDTRLNNNDTKWNEIIKNLNSIFAEYIKCKGLSLEDWMVYSNIKKPVPEPLPASTKGNIFICNVGDDIYHYGYTKNTNIEKEKSKIVKKLYELKDRQLRNLDNIDELSDVDNLEEIDLDSELYDNDGNIHFIYSLMLTNPVKSGDALELFLKGIKALKVNTYLKCFRCSNIGDIFKHLGTLYNGIKNNQNGIKIL